MKALLDGKVIAESDDTVECDGYQYFPSSAVRMEWLEKAEKTESDGGWHFLDAEFADMSIGTGFWTNGRRGPGALQNVTNTATQ